MADNAQALAKGLMDREIKIVSGGTDNHLMLVDLTPYDLTGKAVEKLLDEAHITANKNTIPNDPKSAFVTSGIRLGTPGGQPAGDWLRRTLTRLRRLLLRSSRKARPAFSKARAIVDALTAKYPLPGAF